MHRIVRAGLLWSSMLAGGAQAGEWSGNAAFQWQYFPKEPAFNEQHRSYPSVSLEPEYYHEWNEGKRTFTFESFFRGSQHDSRRSHADIRELNLGIIEHDWELTAGIGKVFWGITESQHLVDIINQTDLVENLDLEQKLGQPMVNLTLVRDTGILDLFVLPGFRERTHPGKSGRPRFSLVVDQDNEIYESGDERKHIDFAARWYQFLGDWEVALSHFKGTSREAELQLTPTGPASLPVLTPVYHQINQTGLEVQGTLGAWLWKLEAIRNVGFDDNPYFAAVGGFEYTHVLESGFEVGGLLEYSWDERGLDAQTQYQNDVLVATRLTFNDAQSTAILAGLLIDAGGAGRTYNVEAETRLGDSWKASLEVRGVFHVNEGDFLYSARRDNSFRFNLAKYF